MNNSAMTLAMVVMLVVPAACEPSTRERDHISGTPAELARATWFSCGPVPDLEKRLRLPKLEFGIASNEVGNWCTDVHGERLTALSDVRWIEGPGLPVATSENDGIYVIGDLSVRGDGFLYVQVATDASIAVWANDEKIASWPATAHVEHRLLGPSSPVPVRVPVRDGMNKLVVQVSQLLPLSTFSLVFSDENTARHAALTVIRNRGTVQAKGRTLNLDATTHSIVANFDLDGRLSAATPEGKRVEGDGRSALTVPSQFVGPVKVSGRFEPAGFERTLNIDHAISSGTGPYLLSRLKDIERKDNAADIALALSASAQRHQMAGGLGPRVETYTSKIDGSVQPFVFHLPRGKRSNELVPLLVVMPGIRTPGCSETGVKRFLAHTWDEVERLSAKADEFGYALMWPRGRNARDHLITVESVNEALQIAKTRFPVDRGKISVAGRFRGAIDAIALAARHPDQFLAAIAIDPLFNVNEQICDAKKAPIEGRSWTDLMSPHMLAPSLHSVPVMLVVNDADQLRARRFLENRESRIPGSILDRKDFFSAVRVDQAEGRMFAFLQGVESGHRSATRRATSRLLRYAATEDMHVIEGKDASLPVTVSLVKSRDGTTRLLTENVRVIALAPRLHAILEGTLPSIGPSDRGGDKLFSGEFRRVVLEDLPAEDRSAVHKTFMREGPIQEFFLRPFEIVPGTAPADQQNQRMLEGALTSRFGGFDRDLERSAVSGAGSGAGTNLLVIGTEESNPAMSSLLEGTGVECKSNSIKLAKKWTGAGRFAAAFVYPDPKDDQRSILFICAKSYTKRLVSEVVEFGGYDFIVRNTDSNELVSSGFFDQSWQ